MLDDIPRNKRGHPSEKTGKSNKTASSERHHIQIQHFQSHLAAGLSRGRSRGNRQGLRNGPDQVSWTDEDRYCIRYELGLCPVHHGAKVSKPLFLLNNGQRFALHFDCKVCEMTVTEACKPFIVQTSSSVIWNALKFYGTPIWLRLTTIIKSVIIGL